MNESKSRVLDDKGICQYCEEQIGYDEPSIIDWNGEPAHLSCSIENIDDMGETSYDGECS